MLIPLENAVASKLFNDKQDIFVYYIHIEEAIITS